MPRKREPLTLEEHKQLGVYFREADAVMSKMLELMSGRVPAKVIDQLLTGRGVDKALYRLRSDLEDLMFREIGHRGGADISIYYGVKEG